MGCSHARRMKGSREIDTEGRLPRLSAMSNWVKLAVALAFMAVSFTSVFGRGHVVSAPAIVAGASPLPLSLDDRYEVRKSTVFVLDPHRGKKRTTQHPVQAFEVERRYFGAVNQFEKRLREGCYHTFQWWAKERSDVTVRFEYRQEKLGAYVLAQEVRYEGVRGSVTTEFSVVGDDYHEDGPVVAWRLLIVRDGRVMGLKQSFLWD